MNYLRLRQIATVAHDLEARRREVEDVLGLEVCYRDPGVEKYGLKNVLFVMGNTFLEIVSPFQEKTAGGRYLERRKGDGGYMYILDCDDLERRRAHFGAKGARIVQDLKVEHGGAIAEAIHLHPRDTGGCLLSVDRHSGGADLKTSDYGWAGNDWRKFDRSPRVLAITGARMQCDDPAATAARWSELLERPVAREGDVWTLEVDNARARFVPLADDRGEGLSAVRLACKDRAAILAAGKARGVKMGEAPTGPWVELVGVRFVLTE